VSQITPYTSFTIPYISLLIWLDGLNEKKRENSDAKEKKEKRQAETQQPQP